MSLLRAAVWTAPHTLLYPLLLQIAKRQGVVNPENTFFSVKRFIGRKMDEVKDECKQVRERWWLADCCWVLLPGCCLVLRGAARTALYCGVLATAATRTQLSGFLFVGQCIWLP